MKRSRARIQLSMPFKVLLVLLTLFCIALVVFSYTVSLKTADLKQQADVISEKLDEINQAGGIEGLEDKIDEVKAQTDLATAEKDALATQLADTEQTAAVLAQTVEEKTKDLDQTKSDNGKSAVEAIEAQFDDLKEDYVDLKIKYYKLRAEDMLNPDEPKVAYLTFDDGPSSNTDKILDILAKYNIKATFFVNWYSSEESAARYKRMVAEGHTIGNHTATHMWKLVYANPDSFAEQVTTLTDNIYNLTGYKITVFRFPGGSSTTRCGGSVSTESKWQRQNNNGENVLLQACIRWLYLNDYQYFDWNVNSTDAEKNLETKENIVKAVLNGCKKLTKSRHAIILMHDTAVKTTTVEALPEIIEGLLEQGYTFGTLDNDSIPYRLVTPTEPKD